MRLFHLYKNSYSGLRLEIWWLAMVTLINRAGAMVLPFLSLYLSKELGYSLSMSGLIMMGYGVGAFAGNWVGGILTDRVGAFRLQALSLLLSGLAYPCLLFLENPWSIGLGLFVTSLLAEMFRPASMASVALLAAKEQRAKAVGLLRLAVNLGFATGPALGGLMAFYYGYNWLFIIDGLTCLLAALFFSIAFRGQLQKENIKSTQKEEIPHPPPHIRQVLRDRPFMLFLGLIFLYSLFFMQFFNAFPVYLKTNMHLLERDIGLLMAYNGLLIVLIEMPMIQLLEKRGLLKMIALGTLLVGLAFGVLLGGTWVGLAWLATTLFTVGEVLSLPFCTTAVLNRSPELLRGRYMALYGMAFSLAHILAPAMGLFLADYIGFYGLWLLMFVAMMFTAWGYFALSPQMDDN